MGDDASIDRKTAEMRWQRRRDRFCADVSSRATICRCAWLATAPIYVRSILEKRGPCHVRGFVRFPFSSPFPIILLLGESISMALRLFFCAAHGNYLGSKVHLLACSGSGRCENEKI